MINAQGPKGITLVEVLLVTFSGVKLYICAFQ
jgi:hypothetical protein